MKVVIADDSMLVREGLARLLADAGIEVMATAGDVPELMLQLRQLSFDAAIVDIRMPPTFTTEGIDAAHAIRDAFPGKGIVVLSQFLESGYASQLLGEAPEHLGYLLKDRVTDVAMILDTLHRVMDGECVLDPTIVTTLIRRPRDPSPLADLTTRELEVLALMAEGRSNVAIAQQLLLSAKTLETHVRRIFQKLRLTESRDDHRRVLAVLAFLQAPDRPPRQASPDKHSNAVRSDSPYPRRHS